MKLKVGETFTVTGPSHFEKATVEKVEKGVYTLSNGLKINSSLEVLGSSRFKVKPFDENEYRYLLATNQIPRFLDQIKSSYKNLPQENLVKVHEKLKKLTQKYL